MQLLVAQVFCYFGLRPMAITKTEIRKVITRLDDMKIELLRLRAQLLPEEVPTLSEKIGIREGRREIEKGHYVTLTQLRKGPVELVSDVGAVGNRRIRCLSSQGSRVLRSLP